MQAPKAEIENERWKTEKLEVDLWKARTAKDEKGMTAESSLLSPLQIIKASLLLAD